MFSGASGRTDLSLSLKNESLPVENDTAPRFPVKKTQIATYEDLKNNQPIDLKTPSNIKTTIEFDPATNLYIFRTKIGDYETATPFSMSADQYMDYTLQQSMARFFKNKNALSPDSKEKNEEFSLKDIKLNLGPGERIFGPGGVQIKTQGYVEATMALRNSRTDDPRLAERNRNKTIFDFNQDIQMNVNASVGDKVNFGMNYDTKALFDFDSKRLKLGYDPSMSGDEDGIVRRIEAGNVSMATTNSLIAGGAALFGITTELQFGKLHINAVASQQESQSQTVSSNGGVQTQKFDFRVDLYDQNRHFFLGHYFRDNYDKGMSKLPFINSPVKITRIEVWVTNVKNEFNQPRDIVAFADLGERKVIKNNIWNPTPGAPETPANGANDLYSKVTSNYAGARNINQVTTVFNGVIENGLDFEKVGRARLLNASEYYINPQLGYLSLSYTLQADEVLAVAYEYTANGNTYQVGEFAADIVTTYDGSNPRSGALFLKLLKPVAFTPLAHTWDLMMKNVYNIGANSIQQDRFRLNISYQADTLGTFINYLPEGKIANQLLLRVMNLDRLDTRNNAHPDGIFDFIEGFTINSQTGRVYFPVIEPFGSYLGEKIDDPDIAKKYVYQQLYDSTQTIASQITEKNKFKLTGSYRAAASNSEISLNATNVPKGSVRVTAAGVTLTEGIDYTIDYISGTVNIINQSLLDTDTPVQISLEDRTFSMQRKMLMGTNLSYDISKNFNVGGTIMHLSERPLVMKTEIGNEAVKNTLWGFNTAFRTESLWLTNLVDKIPFVEATKPSQINFNGEFAHMIAGHFQNKVTGNYSYLDDFEAAESRIDIKNPYAWFLSSTPADKSQDALFPEALATDLSYGKNRALLSWFTIDPIFTRRNSNFTPQHIRNDKEQLSNHFVREIYIREIFPNRDVTFNESATLPVLNLSFYPNERGPYNVIADINSDGYLKNPKKRWGGITRRMDMRDFEAANIEYIEFWLMDPFVYNSTSATPNQGGDLYINLGEISEDVLKDGKKFFENGLPINDDPAATETTIWGKIPTRQSTVYAFDDNQGAAGRKKQDVGLNGLSTEEEFQFGAYSDFVEAFKRELSPDALGRLSEDPFSPLKDPAGDNYHFYRGSDYDRMERSILDRYKYFNGTEGNSPITGENGESYSTASRGVPDVEDMDQDNTLNELESYYQFKIELAPNKMDLNNKYIVDKRDVTVPLRNGTEGKVTWYQFKIPLRQPDKKVGTMRDLRSIRYMRMFLTNFSEPTFLRFGALNLVRGDWRIYEQSLNKDGIPSGSGVIDISTVNIEENSDRRPINYVLPPGTIRELNPDETQLTKENEQAYSIRVANLDIGDARAIYKNTLYDLRRYKRIQLFSHAEDFVDAEKLSKGELTVFIRLGADYQNNYYEYEIPLSITPEGRYSNNSENDRLAVWPRDNMFDFPLELLKNVKLNRNREKRKAGSSVSFTKIYSEYDPEKPNNKVSIIGNPSLSEVNVIMIGVRNNSRKVRSGEVWVNELRLTDFDEEGGWAAQGNLNIALSDLGTINLSGRKETVGFGALDQSLMERHLEDYYMYNVAANVDLGRFIPKKAKVSIPLFYAYSNQTITPKYDPFDQDVTLKESLSILETKAEKDSIRDLALDRTTTKSLSLNNVKVNIQSKTPMPYDPANFSFGYAHNKTEIKNPTTVYETNLNYKIAANYSYSPITKTWEPFDKLKSKSGATKYIKSIGINYLPNNIALNSMITRDYVETQLRDIDNYALGSNTGNEKYFLTWSQAFFWDRDFTLNWDFTRALKFNFQSGTRAEIMEPNTQVNRKLNPDRYEGWRDSVLQSIRNLGDPLSYKQMARLTYELPFRNIPVMDWISSNASYTSGYQWDRGATVENVEVGNILSNTGTFDFNNRFNMTNLYNKWGFLKKVNDRFDNKRRNVAPNQRQREQEQREKENQLKKFSQNVLLKKDTTITITHGLDSKNIRVIAEKDGKSYSIKYKRLNNNSIVITNRDSVSIKVNIQARQTESANSKVFEDILQYSARGLMSVRNIGFNYSKTNGTHIAGFRPYIGDAFGQKNSDNGLVPGLGFAFGLEGGEDFINKSLANDWLIKDSLNINPAVFNSSERFDFRAQIEPIKSLRIELNAYHEKANRTELQYMFEGTPRMLGGSFSMTTVALGTSLRNSNAKNNYRSAAFDKFLENRFLIRDRLESKYDGVKYPTGGFMNGNTLGGDNYSPGAVNPNSVDVLIPAFLSAYTGKDAKNISLTAFPSLLTILPNWTISYDGLSNIPFIKERFKSIILNHGYRCIYQISSYSSFPNWLQAGNAEDGLGFIRDVLTGNPMPSAPYNINSAGIAEVFNPLFGVDGTLDNNMTIHIQYNNGRTLTLNMSSYQIIEAAQQEYIFGLAYRINEFNRIMGLSAKNAKNFNNDLNIRADLSHKTTVALLRNIQEQFTQATAGVTIVTLKVSADYTLSRSLTLRAFYDRIMNHPLISATSYPTTHSNFGISLKFILLQ